MTNHKIILDFECKKCTNLCPYYGRTVKQTHTQDILMIITMTKKTSLFNPKLYIITQVVRCHFCLLHMSQGT